MRTAGLLSLFGAVFVGNPARRFSSGGKRVLAKMEASVGFPNEPGACAIECATYPTLFWQFAPLIIQIFLNATNGKLMFGSRAIEE